MSESVVPDDALWCPTCHGPTVELVTERGYELGPRCECCGWHDLVCPGCGVPMEYDDAGGYYCDMEWCGWGDDPTDPKPDLEPEPVSEPEPPLKPEPPSRYPPKPKHWMAPEKYREWKTGYLQSDTWRDLRSRVLFRTRGTCEGCLERPATEIHHMSYDHEGEEFCFELRALCRKCHARWHGKLE